MFTQAADEAEDQQQRGLEQELKGVLTIGDMPPAPIDEDGRTGRPEDE